MKPPKQVIGQGQKRQEDDHTYEDDDNEAMNIEETSSASDILRIQEPAVMKLKGRSSGALNKVRAELRSVSLPRSDVDEPLKSLHGESRLTSSTPKRRYPTVNHHRLHRANAIDEKVVSEVNEEVLGGQL